MQTPFTETLNTLIFEKREKSPVNERESKLLRFDRTPVFYGRTSCVF